MGRFRHLLSSIRQGGVLVTFVICCRRSKRGGDEGEGMGKLYHLLFSI